MVLGFSNDGALSDWRERWALIRVRAGLGESIFHL
jgi:hypothetical protein